MTAHVTRAAEGLPRRAFTVKDVERMVEVGLIGEDERVELVGGELVPMSAKGNRHEVLKMELMLYWGRTRPDSVKFVTETTYRLTPFDMLEPDFLVIAADLPLAEVKGPTALLVVEIADSSLGYDLGLKASIYAREGVRELWVIDAVTHATHVHRDPGPDGYRSKATASADERLEPRLAPGLAVRLTDLPP